MRIALRTSGGRGEYELAGHQATVKASDLFDRPLAFQLTPDITIPGRQAAHRVQGKPRIRLEDQTASRHAYRLMAAALLLPQPKRELRATSTATDFIRSNQYAVTDIDIDVVSDGEATANLRPTKLWLGNAAGLVRPVDVAERMAVVQAIWDAARSKTSEVAELVKGHEDAVTSGDHRAMERAARDLREKLATDGDVADELAAILGADVDVTAVGTVTGTVPVEGEEDETDPEEAKRRVVAEWRRSVARSAAGRNFSQRVRAAYHDQCAVSGTRLPKLPHTLLAGVDGAHILPWARYELNSLKNGICLNKLCHWAVDAGVLRIDYEEAAEQYVVSIPERVTGEAGPGGMDLEYFEALTGPIPTERLPASTSEWPSPNYLARLNEELYGS